MPKAFTRWWIIILAYAAGLFFAFYYGLVKKILVVDVTHITVVTFAFFAFCSLLLGYASYSIEERTVSQTNGSIRFGWFASQFCMSLGLIGTVSGLIMMMDVQSTGLNISDPSSMLRLVGGAMGSLGTALFTTAVGIGTGMLLQVQCYNLEHSLRELHHGS